METRVDEIADLSRPGRCKSPSWGCSGQGGAGTDIFDCRHNPACNPYHLAGRSSDRDLGDPTKAPQLWN